MKPRIRQAFSDTSQYCDTSIAGWQIVGSSKPHRRYRRIKDRRSSILPVTHMQTALTSLSCSDIGWWVSPKTGSPQYSEPASRRSSQKPTISKDPNSRTRSTTSAPVSPAPMSAIRLRNFGPRSQSGRLCGHKRRVASVDLDCTGTNVQLMTTGFVQTWDELALSRPRRGFMCPNRQRRRR